MYPGEGQEAYLGDGLYASFDGWQVILRAPREGGDHWIGLEPEVYRKLREWISQYPGLQSHMERA